MNKIKITNSEEANKYYKLVNDLIDQQYIKKGIKPASLGSYLKSGPAKLESFIKRNGLDEIEGIKRIIQDVIEDRTHMQLDGILTFESFRNRINESVINNSGMEHEKVLADLYNTSLGHIESIDAEKHTYRVSDFGQESKCVIYSKEELEEIKNKICQKSYQVICKKSLIVDNYTPYIHIDVKSIISEEKFLDEYKKLLTQEVLIEMISGIVEANFSKEFKGYFVWTF